MVVYESDGQMPSYAAQRILQEKLVGTLFLCKECLISEARVKEGNDSMSIFRGRIFLPYKYIE